MKDIAKRRVGRKQWEIGLVIYHHESWDKLWTTLNINQQPIVAKIENKNPPKVYTMVF